MRIPADLWVGAYPVTQAEYRAVLGSLPESLFAGQDRRPVDSVSWLDAVIFCNLLSARDGYEPYYKIQGERVRIEGGTGYRLLTEAEWEYAARGGGTGRYGVTDDAAVLDRFAWYAENSSNQTHEVGLKEPNAFTFTTCSATSGSGAGIGIPATGTAVRSDGDRRPRRPGSRNRARAARRLLELGSAIPALRRQDPVHADGPAALLLRLPRWRGRLKRRRTSQRKRSVQFVNVLSAMGGVADERSASQVNNEIEVFQRQLADQDGHFIRDLHHIHRATSSADGQTNGFVQGGFRDADAGSDRFGRHLRQPQPLDERGRQRK